MPASLNAADTNRPKPLETECRLAADHRVEQQLAAIARRTDRMFAWLMGLQWIAAIVAALWISPRAWTGVQSSVHVHVWAAWFLGGALAGLPVFLAMRHPGSPWTRQTIAVAQMLWSALLIHLTGGRIETHFHVFGSLAILAWYRRLPVILTATAVVALDHLLRGLWWPQSVYGVAAANVWRTFEHAGWVLFEDVFLWYSMRHSLREMRELAAHQIRVERARDVVEREVQQRTQELAAAHQQLMEAARRAGMAETATAVLHNVGNVLNSINVSTGLASEALRRSRVEQLSKAMQLIESNSADLARFFAEDPKGKQLPAFLKLLAVHLADERDEVLQELEYLDQRVGHVKTIVTAQQSYAAGMSGVVETFEVAAALDDAVRLNSSSFERHGIEIIRVHEELSHVQYDKQKLLQILVNLIKNAKDSLAACEAKRRTLTLRTYLGGDDRLFVEVGDNGVGIAPENLTRIFAHGFTTKKEGHGFGLHSCANAAAEMGGRLSVHSDGPGTGATFTLELPFTPAEVTV